MDLLDTVDSIAQAFILFGQLVVVGLIAAAVVDRRSGEGRSGSGWLILTLVTFAIALTPLDLLAFDQGAADQAWPWRIVPLAIVLLPVFVARVLSAVTGLRTPFDLPIVLLGVGAAAWVLFMPTFPGALYEPRPWWFDVAAGFLVVELVLVCVSMTFLLVRAGRDQPHLARVRGRALIFSVVLFGVSVLLWLALPSVVMSLFTSLMFAASPIVFFLAVRAPRALARIVDPAAERALSEAIGRLVGSSDVRAELPHVLTGIARSAGLVGVAALDADGDVVDLVGSVPRSAAQLRESEVTIRAGEPRGASLVGWTTALTPGIGHVDRARLANVASLLELALERSESANAERVAARALERANDRLRAADRQKDELMAFVSHELRTPLTSIIGLARTAADRWDALDHDQLRAFQTIIAEQGERLQQIAGDLLTIAQIDAHALGVDTTDMTIASMIDDAVHDAGLDSTPVDVEVDERAGRWRSDRRLVHDMLVNYLSNARKYGEPPIEVSAHMRDGALEMTVRDHGDGVPDDVRERLFERFARGSTVGETPGTGLGLAIVHDYAELLGGSSGHRVPSDGEGSEFWFRLPTGRT